MSDSEDFVCEAYGPYKSKCKPCDQPRGKGDMDVNENYKFGYGKEDQDEFCLNGYGPSKKRKYCKPSYCDQEPREYIRFDRKDRCQKKTRALSDWNRFVRQRTKGSGKAVDFKKLSNEYKEMKRRFKS